MYDKICVFSLMCCSLFGIETVSLKTLDLSGENIIGTNVGVRPVRKYGPRIEAEKVGDKLIVHNYGYGGSGITLSLGGSEEVVSILEAQNLENKTVAVLGAGVIGLTTAYDLLKLGVNVRIYSSDWSPNLTSNVGSWHLEPLITTL